MLLQYQSQTKMDDSIQLDSHEHDQATKSIDIDSKSINIDSKSVEIDSGIRAISVTKNVKKARSGGRSGYQRHPKPPFSYIALIAMAIRDSPKGKLTLAEINEYLMRKFSFFRGDYQGWKNSIRHNLSLNECFVKILRDPNRPWGKDNYWALNLSSEYTFADGMFRRRRKKIMNSNTSGGDSSMIHDHDEIEDIDTKIKSIDSRSSSIYHRRKYESFSIENLLKKDAIIENQIQNNVGITNWTSSVPVICSNSLLQNGDPISSLTYNPFLPVSFYANPAFYYTGQGLGFVSPNWCIP